MANSNSSVNCNTVTTVIQKMKNYYSIKEELNNDKLVYHLKHSSYSKDQKSKTICTNNNDKDACSIHFVLDFPTPELGPL